MGTILKNVLAFVVVVFVGIAAGCCLEAEDALERTIDRHSHKRGVHRIG